MFGRFLCWLGWHRPPESCNPKLAIVWCCDRCSALVPGDMGLGR